MSFTSVRLMAVAVVAALSIAACDGSGVPSGDPSASGSASSGPGSSDGVPGESPGPATDDAAASPGVSSSDAPILGVVDEARLAKGETPGDWVEITSGDGACRQAVPPDWIESGLPGQVLSPEIQATSVLANDTFEAWPAYVQHLQATYFTDGQEVLVENDRLFLLRSTERGGASHVLALNGGTTACGIVLAIDEAGIDQYASIGIQILYTLAGIG